jgi:MYXO-CTERM domain-containing protein
VAITFRAAVALGAGALALGACLPAGPETTGIEGDLTVLVSDHADGHSERHYLLTAPGLGRTPLAFARDPQLASGQALRVWGTPRVEGGLDVSRFEVTEAAGAGGVLRSALRTGDPLPTRSFAFVLLDTGQGVNVTNAGATQEMFDAAYFAPNKGSVRHYYQEVSYARQDITGAVVGPLSFKPASSCDPDGALALRAQVDALVGGPSTNYLWYFGSQQSGCGWEGLATLGTPNNPTRDSWFNASTSCVVLVQEPGHNFGMQHSSSMRCGGKTFVDAPAGVCSHIEYGDTFDPMGSACRHMNGWQKQYQGWLGGCNSVRLSASGTFTLLPLEGACDGIQVLQIPMPHTRTFSYTGDFAGATSDELTYYYVELRAQTAGFDQGLGPQVQIRVGGDYRPKSQNGLHTWLLDMNPATSTFSDAALAVGQTFDDPAGGLSITATAVSASSATIAVTIANGQGAPTCLDGTTLEPPGPATCAGPGSAGAGGGDGGAGGSAGGGGGPSPGSAGSGDTGGAGGVGGPAGASGGGADAGSAGADAGAAGAGGPGCGCRAGSSASPTSSLLLGVLALALAPRRSRRRGP